jgi:hypothetical protein
MYNIMNTVEGRALLGCWGIEVVRIDCLD